MKSYFLQAIFFIAFILSSRAQEIAIYKTFGGVRFERDTVVLSIKMVSEILRENPLALEEFRKARANYNTAGVLGFTGGVLILIPITTAILGGDPEWAIAIGGAALIVVEFARLIFNGKRKHNLAQMIAVICLGSYRPRIAVTLIPF